MKTWHLPISRACNNRCVFCSEQDRLDGRPIAAKGLRRALEAGAQRGYERVVLTGGEPTLSRQMVAALAFARGLGLTTAITTNGRFLSDMEKIGRLEAVGLDEVIVSVHGLQATHTSLTGGDPVTWTQVVRTLGLVRDRFRLTIRTVLTRANADEIDDLVALSADHGARYDLRRLRPVGGGAATDLDVSDAEAMAILARTHRTAHDLGVPLSWWGFDGTGLRSTPAGEPVVPDATDLALLQRRTPTARHRHGLKVTPEVVADVAARSRVTPDEVLVRWAAQGTPAGLPLPASTATAGATRFAIVVPDQRDPLLAHHTLPALADALTARGAEASLHTIWRRPTRRRRVLSSLRRLVERPTGLDPAKASDADVAAAGADLLASLELSDDTVVVVPHAGVSVAGRRHIMDAEPLAGFTEARADDVFRSPAPSLVRLYGMSQVPLTQVHWRPYPVPHAALPDRSPSPTPLVATFTGGHGDPSLPRPAVPTTSLDGLDLQSVLDVLARAWVLWLPLRVRKYRLVDLRWPTLAMAMGVPLVATEVSGVADLVVDGVTGTLVPPGHGPRAAASLDAIVGDRALRERMSAASVQEGRKASVEVWAQELVDGAPAARMVRDHGPWRCW
jgi:MoaA/NifB/PqqE/SkfB family radical SAM enzyme